MENILFLKIWIQIFLKNLAKIQIFFKNFIPHFYKIFFEIKILEFFYFFYEI